ncbi:ABC transporter substrate-binding protein [Acuticoccus sp. I52.16.1]|uniref:ABC transporter substrate-binding protein n=1 Tax=Acuticoccus sp. I52.16.1 TaxID=2928472 RepID=UPI001FD00BA2|nr:ABC transporter substrate-binding protein [Acuticoccus sp. I52.16.1]UOM33004.1 ABC transporter substrate-binding protein [Acuticoccus sp. I52.16.1]
MLAASFVLAGAAAAQAPQRIVSMNLCADELLLRLAPERVVSVTWLSQDPAVSTLAAAARRRVANHGQAEEVVALAPDLVVAGRYTTATATAFLRRLGVEVALVDPPATLAAARATITRLADRIGASERGAALVAQLDRGVAAVAADGAPPRAIVLDPNGFTVGAGSLVAELMARAGLANVAPELGIENYGRLPLEAIVTAGIEVLIVDAEAGEVPALATELLAHPALRRLGRRIVTASVPSRLWTCAGPQLGEAVRILADAAHAARVARRGEAGR